LSIGRFLKKAAPRSTAGTASGLFSGCRSFSKF